jgi:hypothetical protein
MLWTKRSIIASAIMGFVGAVIGGFYTGYFFTALNNIDNGRGVYWDFNNTLIGAALSFLVCFFISIWYLGVMQKKGSKSGFSSGLIFGVIAGVISGFVSSFAVEIRPSILAGASGNGVGFLDGVGRCFLGGLFGGVGGMLTGLVIGSLSAGIAGPFLLKYLTTRR